MADRGGKAPASTSAAAVDVDAAVVIVGAGIAGLATALALRRLGVGAAGGGVLVLERHAELRSTGAALTIFPNGRFALRALGVAHKLTSRYDAFETFRGTTLETGATQVFRFAGRKSRLDDGPERMQIPVCIGISNMRNRVPGSWYMDDSYGPPSTS